MLRVALVAFSLLTAPVSGLEIVAFEALSDRSLGLAGRALLTYGGGEWQHAETEHFVLHFSTVAVARPVAVEAEFYYRVIMADLEVKAPPDAGKNHLYLFESAEAWKLFAQHLELEEWTGAAKIGNELFVPRLTTGRIKQHALGHEIAHLLVARFIGGRLPLWLSEGYAEDVSLRAHAAFYRARGYRAVPRTLPLEGYIPLERLTSFTHYPADPQEVLTFYRQTRRLTAFLNRFGDRKPFLDFLRRCSTGEALEPALRAAYRTRWHSLRDLEEAFRAELARDGDR